MKVQLRSLEKVSQLYKTQRKEFDLPYFETISEAPIIEVSEEDLEAFNKFFYEFNGFMDIYQIGVQILEESKT